MLWIWWFRQNGLWVWGYQVDRLYLVGSTCSFALMVKFKTSSPAAVFLIECETEWPGNCRHASFPCILSPHQYCLTSAWLSLSRTLLADSLDSLLVSPCCVVMVASTATDTAPWPVHQREGQSECCVLSILAELQTGCRGHWGLANQTKPQNPCPLSPVSQTYLLKPRKLFWSTVARGILLLRRSKRGEALAISWTVALYLFSMWSRWASLVAI